MNSLNNKGKILSASTSKTNPKKIPSTILIPVFLPAVIVLALMIIGTLSNQELAASLFRETLTFVTRDFGWFYMLSVAIFLIFIVIVSLTSWGNIKLSSDHEEPEYSFLSWFAMLFSAGYGIALLFFGVAEPVLHYASPPQGTALTIDSAKQAMQISFFHWGFHIWAIYGLVGLTLAYFAFRHQLPLSMRSVLYPFIGNKIYGAAGHTIDTFAVLGTTFGVATTLGLSVAQINTGMNYIWPAIPTGNFPQVITVIVITALATFSVVAGMDKGIKRLSLLNIWLAFLLLVFVLAVGPTIFILETFLQNTGSYLNNIVERSLNLQAYESSDWIGNWTLFIFGWTIAWAPFVGLFIAKISRGRTIRQFVLGVILVPSFFTFLWFSVFGDTALHLIIHQGYQELITQVQADHSIALFKMLEALPLVKISSFLVVILIVTFFVTSADSAALVIDSLASGGAENTPVWQRIFWTSLLGIVASVLLISGGLKSLQTAAIVSALPFAVIMLIAVAGLWRALLIESKTKKALKKALKNNRQITNKPGFWKERLNNLVEFATEKRIKNYIENDVFNTMKKLQKELISQDWPAKVYFDQQEFISRIEVIKTDDFEFMYEVRKTKFELPEFTNDLEVIDNKDNFYYRAQVFVGSGAQEYDVYGYDENELIHDILKHFERYLQFVESNSEILNSKILADSTDLLKPISQS